MTQLFSRFKRRTLARWPLNTPKERDAFREQYAFSMVEAIALCQATGANVVISDTKTGVYKKPRADPDDDDDFSGKKAKDKKRARPQSKLTNKVK